MRIILASGSPRRKELLNSVNKYRLNSEKGEIKEENYFRINNTNISAEDVAKMIKEKFEL